MLVGSQEADVGGYRPHTSTAAHYGGQYSSVYGSAALSGAQQVNGLLLKYVCVCASHYLASPHSGSTKPHPSHFTCLLR